MSQVAPAVAVVAPVGVESGTPLAPDVAYATHPRQVLASSVLTDSSQATRDATDAALAAVDTLLGPRQLRGRAHVKAMRAIRTAQGYALDTRILAGATSSVDAASSEPARQLERALAALADAIASNAQLRGQYSLLVIARPDDVRAAAHNVSEAAALLETQVAGVAERFALSARTVTPRNALATDERIPGVLQPTAGSAAAQEAERFLQTNPEGWKLAGRIDTELATVAAEVETAHKRLDRVLDPRTYFVGRAQHRASEALVRPQQLAAAAAQEAENVPELAAAVPRLRQAASYFTQALSSTETAALTLGPGSFRVGPAHVTAARDAAIEGFVEVEQARRLLRAAAGHAEAPARVTLRSGALKMHVPPWAVACGTIAGVIQGAQLLF